MFHAASRPKEACQRLFILSVNKDFTLMADIRSTAGAGHRAFIILLHRSSMYVIERFLDYPELTHHSRARHDDGHRYSIVLLFIPSPFIGILLGGMTFEINTTE
jgi:hypothetical protein